MSNNIDQIRTRLLTLNSALGKLRENISTTNPLPSWTSLQTHTNLIANNLQSITEQLAEHQQTLASTEVFPLPRYPGKQQGFILETLLRTKLEPNVEDWLDQGRNIATGDASARGLSDRDRNELWQWAPSAANAEARKQKWGADYTLAEKIEGVENVVTGLRRELVEPPDDIDDEGDEYDEFTDEEDEPDKMEVEQQKVNASNGALDALQPVSSAPQMPLETVHKYMTTGKVG